MIIAATSSYTLGRFTVQQRPRFDNPAWAVYIVFLGERLIGKSFSMPDIGCCEWLQRNSVYATDSQHLRAALGRRRKPGTAATAELARRSKAET
jgi:hypothetical protein